MKWNSLIGIIWIFFRGDVNTKTGLDLIPPAFEMVSVERTIISVGFCLLWYKNNFETTNKKKQQQQQNNSEELKSRGVFLSLF